MKSSRRKFLGSVGIGAIGLFGSNSVLKGNTSRIISWPNLRNANLPGTHIPGIGKGGNPQDVKVNIKVVYYALIHTSPWQGPCRFRGSDERYGKEEQDYNRNRFNEYVKRLRSTLSPDARMLEPVYLEFPGLINIRRQDLAKLEADTRDVDLYIVAGSNLSQYLSGIIGEIYKKPVYDRADSTTYLRSRGLEGYYGGQFDGGLNKLISLLRARKVFQQTNMLLITDLGIPGYPVTSAVRDFEDLNNRFGIGATIIDYNELSDERDKIVRKGMSEVEAMTDKLIGNAQRVNNIGREQLKGDVLVYHTVKSLMNKYNCNAFTIECFEWCASQQPDKWRANPCLTHSLLRDEGYPSACEGDISVLLALNVFMALSKSSAYMGNMYSTMKGQARSWDACGKTIRETEKWVPGVDTEGVKLAVGHDVPGLKMLGFDKSDLPYELRNFVCGNPTGWGAQLKIDFTKIKERTVTIGQFNSLANKMLVTKGEVIGMRGFDNEGCSTRVIIDVKDPKGYHTKYPDYGHHHAMVYGDYSQDIAHLAEMLKIKVDFHNV
jgi:hypothetical protein